MVVEQLGGPLRRRDVRPRNVIAQCKIVRDRVDHFT
jgi:hypothetical protein